MWQDIIVGICVLAAVFFVARQWIPGLGKKPSGCGGCNGCSSSAGSCRNGVEPEASTRHSGSPQS
ncbi:Virus attachment protein p12 family protein [Marinobacter antarcticus]|uniref:Virus attachment protein p12 family protein n=1 Tax=Marinobacter antarcticus TaxID=564117 RepID=A0A1M6PBG3_9GAMM|nr:FeoB-associated Cys-rich membrane protein [Marinobacter antarcticus]SHK05264.1 Virus attachment protein p12 family protein [Marinobacter antarcticus]